MKQKVQVCKVFGAALTFIKEDAGVCFGCMNMQCKKERGFFTSENCLPLILHPEDSVEINLSRKTLAVQGLSALLPPVLGFIAGYVLAVYIFPAPGEAARAAFGAVLMIAAASAVYVYRRRFPAKIEMKTKAEGPVLSKTGALS
jgi:sigma-E factor negative regulatory protein RseC